MAAMTPDQIKKTFAKAHAAQTAGRFGEAIKGYQRIQKSAPQLPEVHFNLGEIAARQGRFAEAAGAYEAALKLRPGEAAIWKSYLDLASKHPKTDNLAVLLKRVGTALDQLPEIDFYRGLVAPSPEVRTKLYQSAIGKGAKSPRLYAELGLGLEKAGDTDGALDIYGQGLVANPTDERLLSHKSDLLRNLGRLEEAKTFARNAVEAAPKAGSLYYSYASIAKLQSADPMIKKMEQAFGDCALKDPAYPHLAYALAKAMQDTGQTDRVFDYLNAASRHLRTAFPYDAEADHTAAGDIRKLYEAGLESRSLPGTAAQEPRPIFITGLPRSGTTLIEQILSSHSQVTGGGELGFLGGQLMALQGRALEIGIATEDLAEGLLAVGQSYRDQLADKFPDAPVITDKSISTYASLGFIHHALPDAKIIVVRRSPEDNALSIYKNFFPVGTHRYSNDLHDIARFMRLFERQIDYWAEKTPDTFLQVRYEDVVASLEDQARAIVAHAGLDWEEACLEFHKNRRKVDTLSATQVRQPIYTSSLEAWRRFETELQPFLTTYRELGGSA